MSPFKTSLAQILIRLAPLLIKKSYATDGTKFAHRFPPDGFVIQVGGIFVTATTTVEKRCYNPPFFILPYMSTLDPQTLKVNRTVLP